MFFSSSSNQLSTSNTNHEEKKLEKTHDQSWQTNACRVAEGFFREENYFFNLTQCVALGKTKENKKSNIKPKF